MDAKKTTQKNIKYAAALIDHVRREVCESKHFETDTEARKWALDQCGSYCEKGDKIVFEKRNIDGKQWREYMVQTPDGGILDFYVEIHKLLGA